MASFRFNLNGHPDRDGMDRVRLDISFKVDGVWKRRNIITSVSVNPDNWNQENQKVSKKDYLFPTKNGTITDLRRKCEDAILLMANGGLPGIESVVGYITNTKVKVKQRKDVWEQWKDDYIEMNKTHFAYNTLRSKNSCYNTFKEYGHLTSWEDVDQDYYTKFISWCWDTKEYSNGNVGRLIKELKLVMDYGWNREWHQNLSYKKKWFSKPASMTSIVAFTPEELREFANIKCIGGYKEVQDAVLFSCFTGLRYSDVMILTRANVMGNWLMVTTEKTGSNIWVPLIPEAMAIIDSYTATNRTHKTMGLLPMHPDQVMNKFLHRMLKRNNFDREVEMIRLVKRQKIREVKPLHEVFTFHCAKKTFISIFKNMGGDTHVVMSITGNTDIGVVQKSYMDISRERMADEMENAWGKWRDNTGA